MHGYLINGMSNEIWSYKGHEGWKVMREAWVWISWMSGTESATVKGVIASQSTQFSWPDMAPIRLFPSASCVCAWPSYIHSLLVHQMCRHQDSQWHRQFEFQSASSHPCTNERWIPLPTNQVEMKEWGNGESSNHNFKRSLQGILSRFLIPLPRLNLLSQVAFLGSALRGIYWCPWCNWRCHQDGSHLRELCMQPGMTTIQRLTSNCSRHRCSMVISRDFS